MVQSKRFRGKINIQRPRPPHYERALFNAVTQPIYEKIPIVVKCRQTQLDKIQQIKVERDANQYEKILARELREIFEMSEMALICQKNSITSYDNFTFQVALHKHGVKVKAHGKRILKEALQQTKYENLLRLMDVSTCMLFGNASSIGHVLKVLRKTPQIILLAGTMSDRILSKSELVAYSKLPDIQLVRAQFAATLNTAGGQILNHLQAHQSNLCYMLDAHAKSLADNSSAETKEEQTAPKQQNE